MHVFTLLGVFVRGGWEEFGREFWEVFEGAADDGWRSALATPPGRVELLEEPFVDLRDWPTIASPETADLFDLSSFEGDPRGVEEVRELGIFPFPAGNSRGADAREGAGAGIGDAVLEDRVVHGAGDGWGEAGWAAGAGRGGLLFRVSSSGFRVFWREAHLSFGTVLC